MNNNKTQNLKMENDKNKDRDRIPDKQHLLDAMMDLALKSYSEEFRKKFPNAKRYNPTNPENKKKA